MKFFLLFAARSFAECSCRYPAGIHYIYLFIKQRPKFRHRGVGTHQRHGKREEGRTSEKSEEMPMDRFTEGEYPCPSQAIDTLMGPKENKKN